MTTPSNGTISSPTLSSSIISSTPISSSLFSSSTPETSFTPSSSPSISSPPPSSSIAPSVLTSTVVQTVPTTGPNGGTSFVIRTITTSPTVTPGNTQSAANSAPASTTSSGSTVAAGDTNSTQPASNPGTIAAAVVAPLVVVALLVLAGLWFWRKRKQRKEAEELRKKEMEEYSYNPNNDPTIPAVGALSSNGDEGERDGGYRGWGTTTSATRKASTTLSGSNGIGIARSDSGGHGYNGSYSPNAPNSDVHSGDPLMDRTSGNSETIGALGAAPVSGNRGGGVNRGPSNASSAYSGGGNRSDGSGEGPTNGHVGSPQYYNELMYQEDGLPHNHVDSSWGGQPVIRDVSARRNTRIENPSVIPHQGNTGISQNF